MAMTLHVIARLRHMTFMTSMSSYVKPCLEKLPRVSKLGSNFVATWAFPGLVHSTLEIYMYILQVI